jgi:nicotinate-nucleotide pyrophosphorylase (carboxylating)
VTDATLPPDIAAVVAGALAEDVGTGDLTAALIDPFAQARARVMAREPAVVCGRAWFDETFRQVDAGIRIRWHVNDGDAVAPDAVLCELSGLARGLLTGERTALNFLQLLSGTATATRRLVDIVAGTNTRILDTRKTVPGLRRAQKYAVRCGGGCNHRIGLFDAVLIKENHVAAAGGVGAAVTLARKTAHDVLVEVEVETLEQLNEALETDADRIMLDNFTLDALRVAVAQRDAHGGRRKELEASGGIDEGTLRAVAGTGVDFVSIGAITKHVRAIDLSMRFY